MLRYAHAVVIGGSIAGLLAARVLSRYFEQVTVLERDTLSEQPVFRGGVPQAKHGHLLLAKGQQIVERLLPGIRGEFANADMPSIHWGKDSAVLTAGGWMKTVESGIHTQGCSRIWLEWAIRRQVACIPNVQIKDNCRVADLIGAAGAVRGVRLSEGEELRADMVVDASGRASKTPQWLQSLGYATPPETNVNPFMSYATRWYRALPGFPWKLLISHARPAEQNWRNGGIVQVEDGQWMVILGGANKFPAPTNDAEFFDFARNLAAPQFLEALQNAEPISEIHRYQQTANRVRHYEKLPRLPDGLIVLGDAVCTFNPIYGQGMSVAALEAELLDHLLAEREQLRDFAPLFQKALFKTVSWAWLMATGADLIYPNTEGDRPGWAARRAQRYIDTLTHIMPHDEGLTHTFLRIMHLLDAPTTLFKPTYLWKALRISA